MAVGILTQVDSERCQQILFKIFFYFERTYIKKLNFNMNTVNGRILVFLLITLIPLINTLAVYLPENKNLKIYELSDDIQALKQQQGLNNNTNAIGQYQKSYDKFSDVTKRASVQQQQQTDEGLNAEDTNIRKKRGLSEWLIAPNTRWCGRGNTANGTYNVIGGASLADKCCRRHDHCPTFISAMSNRYDLFNYRPYTLSSCMCDRRFRTCLKMANDEDANTIGQLFFNFVQTQCFVLKTETICRKRGADGSCEQKEVKKKAYLRNNKRF